MATQVYAPFLTSNTVNFNYAVPNTSSRVTYPVESEALGILGPIFVPSVYARDLDNLEIGSSGSIALSLLDKYTLSITKNTSNATVFQSVDNQPISIQPGDASKTVTIGDMIISGTDMGSGVRRVNVGGSGFRFGNFLDLTQASNVVTMSSGLLPFNLMGKSTGFVDTATNTVIGSVSRNGNNARVSMSASTPADFTQIIAGVTNSSNLSNLSLVANNLCLQNAQLGNVMSISGASNVLTIMSGSSSSNPMSMQFVPTDSNNTVIFGNMMSSKNTDSSGMQTSVLDITGFGPATNGGFVVKQNVAIDPTKRLIVANITGYSGNIVLDSGVVINGPLTIHNNGNVSNISWNNVNLVDKLITLSVGSSGSVPSSLSGISVDCGPAVPVSPSMLWNANNQANTAVAQASADSECFWRLSGGHMRLASPTVDYGFRINSKLEMELFRVRYDSNHNQVGTATVLTRWGAALPTPR